MKTTTGTRTHCRNGHTLAEVGVYIRPDGYAHCRGCQREALKRYQRPPIYGIWQGMLSRCENPNNPQYKHYGGRGISVCKRWHTYANFEKDMGPRPSKNHSIDRIDPNGNYEPDNCRWATAFIQNNNRRDSSGVVLYEEDEATKMEYQQLVNEVVRPIRRRRWQDKLSESAKKRHADRRSNA